MVEGLRYALTRSDRVGVMNFEVRLYALDRDRCRSERVLRRVLENFLREPKLRRFQIIDLEVDRLASRLPCFGIVPALL